MAAGSAAMQQTMQQAQQHQEQQQEQPRQQLVRLLGLLLQVVWDPSRPLHLFTAVDTAAALAAGQQH